MQGYFFWLQAQVESDGEGGEVFWREKKGIERDRFMLLFSLVLLLSSSLLAFMEAHQSTKHSRRERLPVYSLTCISLFISARCHSPASGERGGRSHVNQSVASWRHRSVLLSPIRARRQVWATKPLTLSTLPAPRLHFSFFFHPHAAR